jgi:hypothetical protein
MMFRSGRQGAAVIVDPALPTSVKATVRMVARQHPQVLRDPAAPLPHSAGFDHAKAAVGARGVLLTIVLGGAVLPALLWLMPRMLSAETGGGSVSHYHRNLIVAATAVAVAVVVVLEVLHTRVSGGRKAVARDLAEARNRYLLPGTHLDSTAWASAVRAQRALADVAACTFLLTSVDGPDHEALARSFWTLAKDMADSGRTAAMDSFAAAVEVYASAVEAADAISMTPTRSGPDKERHEQAIERANSAGRHAIAMAQAV